MEKINRQAKTLEQWEEILMPEEFKAVINNCYPDPAEILTPDEVLDIIVEWNGGITTGYHIRSMISRVYGVEL